MCPRAYGNQMLRLYKNNVVLMVACMIVTLITFTVCFCNNVSGVACPIMFLIICINKTCAVSQVAFPATHSTAFSSSCSRAAQLPASSLAFAYASCLEANTP